MTHSLLTWFLSDPNDYMKPFYSFIYRLNCNKFYFISRSSIHEFFSVTLNHQNKLQQIFIFAVTNSPFLYVSSLSSASVDSSSPFVTKTGCVAIKANLGKKGLEQRWFVKIQLTIRWCILNSIVKRWTSKIFYNPNFSFNVGLKAFFLIAKLELI